jgi:hypothetical protein
MPIKAMLEACKRKSPRDFSAGLETQSVTIGFPALCNDLVAYVNSVELRCVVTRCEAERSGGYL